MTDILLHHNGYKTFSWGNGDLYKTNNIRKRYLKALRAADNYDYTSLIEFVDN